MTIWLAVAGWALAAGLAVRCAGLAHRLDLVADADHELRAPLSALVLAVEALGRHPELRRRATALETHLDRLRLGLADLTAARAGRRHRPDAGAVRLEGLARAVVEAWSPAATAAGGEVRLDWEAGPVTVAGDRARLSQALGNLLANAVEHGGGKVELRGERRDGRVRIAVSDEGSRTGAESSTRPEPAPAVPAVPGRRGRGRGRGLGIAASALTHAGGSLETPDLTTVFGRSDGGLSRGGAPGPAAGQIDDAPIASRAPAGQSGDAPIGRSPKPGQRGVTVTIDLPVTEEERSP